MTAMNKKIYRAFKTVGAPEDEALAAAESVPEKSELATKSDLYRALWVQAAAIITIIAGLFAIIASSG